MIEDNNIINVDLEKKMKDSYLEYSMSVIVSRALPDVRDGLKPVHRRILYGMEGLGLDPNKPTRKSARVVGDVMGKYHPHGDSAIYDALVRLAQDFSTRYPLAQGQGNFGSIDGDDAAAMRYTEVRMSKIAKEMLRDINKDTVDFMPNFDEEELEPVVLPSRFPNLLVNGSNGIAVGMATNMAPHNLGESIDACIAYMKDPEISIEDLNKIIPGPDFPTGAYILGKAGIKDAYSTGRGKVKLRAVCKIEPFKKNRERIIISEMLNTVDNYPGEFIFNYSSENQYSHIIEVDEDSPLQTSLLDTISYGIKWVYYSVKVSVAFQNEMLVKIYDLIESEPSLINFHFVRYTENNINTLRLRFELNNKEQSLYIIEKIESVIGSHIYSVNRFTPEINRYGGKKLFEDIYSYFTLDSMFVIKIIKNKKINNRLLLTDCLSYFHILSVYDPDAFIEIRNKYLQGNLKQTRQTIDKFINDNTLNKPFYGFLFIKHDWDNFYAKRTEFE